ncbi:hypothetical protein Esti_000697 [Eimeria stiedai]
MHACTPVPGFEGTSKRLQTDKKKEGTRKETPEVHMIESSLPSDCGASLRGGPPLDSSGGPLSLSQKGPPLPPSRPTAGPRGLFRHSRGPLQGTWRAPLRNSGGRGAPSYGWGGPFVSSRGPPREIQKEASREKISLIYPSPYVVLPPLPLHSHQIH